MMFRGAHRSGVATIERSDGNDLPVLLWEITPEDEKALDRYEGYPYLYRKETILVFFEGRTLRAMAYVMNERYPYTVPSRSYESVIAEGYRDMGVPRRILDEAIKETMTEDVRKAILAVRDTGKTNMFDVINVMKIARELGHENLVKYLRNPLNGPEYMNFILRGKTR